VSEFPVGRVASAFSELIYVPREGITTESNVFDSFEYTASDCQGVSTPATVSISVVKFVITISSFYIHLSDDFAHITTALRSCF
jgi:hypothetical protein